MKKSPISIALLISFFAFGQPNPQIGYPKRIAAITEQLIIDSLNYELIWERLKMKVNLMGGFGIQDEIFLFNVDSTNQVKRKKLRELYFDEFNTDFNKIYDNIIKVKKYDIVEEGDFYLNRIWFCFNMGEIDKAIADATYLRDSASYSRFWHRDDYYNNWALYSLFNLCVINNQYEDALEAINTMLKKKKTQDAKVYFAGGGAFLSYSDKIRLFEHFNKKDKIIPFLKEKCIEHFIWYFENIKPNDYYTEQAKYNGFFCLKQLVGYMKEYNDKELPKFEKIYNQLRCQLNENFETINPNISDNELKMIISEI